MNFSTETTLLVGVVALYMLDSTMLLYSNELVLMQHDGRWRCAWPSAQWQVSGRSIYLPNPLTPDEALFRTFWSTTRTDDGGSLESLQEFFRALKPLRYMTIALVPCFSLCVPFVLYVTGTLISILVVVILVYMVVIVMLAYSFQRRVELGLSTRDVARLAFDSLVCVPNALNLVRKITEKRLNGTDPVRFVQLLFSPEKYVEFVETLCGKVQEHLEMEDESSPKYHALKAFQAKVAALPSCQLST